MKIKANVFAGFLRKVNLNNKIEEAILEFGENGIRCKVMSPTNAVLIETTLNKSAFESYDPIGDIAIDQIGKMINFLSRFHGSVDINHKGNIILLTGKTETSTKEAEFCLPSTEYVKETREITDLKYPINDLELERDIFESIVGDAVVLKTNIYRVKIKEKTLTLEVGEQDKFREKINVNSDAEVNLSLPEEFADVISNCESKIKISIGSGIPLTIIDNSENIKTKYLVAPYQGDEDTPEEKSGE